MLVFLNCQMMSLRSQVGDRKINFHQFAYWNFITLCIVNQSAVYLCCDGVQSNGRKCFGLIQFLKHLAVTSFLATHPNFVQISNYCKHDSKISNYRTRVCISSAHHCLPHLFLFHADMMSMGKKMVHELLGAFPGIDEAMSFAEVMRYCMCVIG